LLLIEKKSSQEKGETVHGLIDSEVAVSTHATTAACKPISNKTFFGKNH
jgi:hypothetical protein